MKRLWKIALCLALALVALTACSGSESVQRRFADLRRKPHNIWAPSLPPKRLPKRLRRRKLRLTAAIAAAA